MVQHCALTNINSDRGFEYLMTPVSTAFLGVCVLAASDALGNRQHTYPITH